MEASSNNKVDLAEIIRQAFRESGMTRAELSRRSGVFYSALHGFIGSDRDISISTASKLMEALGLTVTSVKRKKGTK